LYFISVSLNFLNCRMGEISTNTCESPTKKGGW